MTKGFDLKVRSAVLRPAVRSAAKRSLAITQALEWAFATERVALEFDEMGTRAGCDTVWTLMQRGLLGCEIDGGGTSPGHDDAEVIASLVACLPMALGGKSMAVQIAQLARTGSSPDWMRDARPRCVAVEMRMTKHGLYARTELMGSVETTYRGRKIKHDILACPVTYRPSAAQIGVARREYLAWWGALLDLRHTLSVAGLRTIMLTAHMPAMTPWKKGVDG